MSLRDPKVLRIALTLVLSAMALWSFYVSDLLPFGYRPRAKQTRELRASYETVSTELEKARRTVNNLPQLEKEHADLERKWKQAEALLPSDKEVAELLTQITQAGEQAGVSFEMFKPQASKPQEFYNENPVQIQIEGGFHQVGVFLSRLANLSRIVNVTDLHLAGLQQTSGKARKANSGAQQADQTRTDHTLEASFTATAYSLRDVIAEPAQGPPAERPNGSTLGAGMLPRLKTPAIAKKVSGKMRSQADAADAAAGEVPR